MRGPSLAGRLSSSKPRCGKTSSHGKEIEIDRRYRDLSRAAGLLKGADLRLICLADMEMTDSDSTFSDRSSSAVSPTEGPTQSQDSVRTVLLPAADSSYRSLPAKQGNSYISWGWCLSRVDIIKLMLSKVMLMKGQALQRHAHETLP